MPEPSGAQWCARFPGSASVNDLLPEFRANVNAFLAALHQAGAAIAVSATFRPPERAYLMHWAFGIATGLPPYMCRPIDQPNTPIDPATVPALAGVDIDWTHGGNLAAARIAAQQMVTTYGLAYPAALASNHTVKRAIDMTITWQGVLGIADANGQQRAIASQPRSGMNPELWAVGKTFGVLKLPSDKPHWSDDGH